MIEGLILIGAGLAVLGVPRVAPGRRRLLHAWIENGLLPLGLGLIFGAGLDELMSSDAALLFQNRLRSLLVLILAAAGVLTGTQLRLAFLDRAGATFLLTHSRRALLLALLASLCLIPLGLLLQLPILSTLILATGLSTLALASSQQPPASSQHLLQRELITLHIAPSGWWNLLALLLAGLAFSLPSQSRLLPASWPGALNLLLACLACLTLGLALGWLARRARNRDEAYLFNLAVLGLTGGGALILGIAPLLAGILVGAAFANVALTRSSLVEAALGDLEQPVILAAGLFAGLAVTIVWPPALAWTLIALILLPRLLLRAWLNPSDPQVSPPRQRRYLPPGATSILILGSLQLAGHDFRLLALPTALALLLLALIAIWAERPARKKASPGP